MSLISTSDISGQKLDQLDQSFMYTQLIKEILLELKYNNENFNELVTYSLNRYSKDAKQRPIVSLFQNEYRSLYRQDNCRSYFFPFLLVFFLYFYVKYITTKYDNYKERKSLLFSHYYYLHTNTDCFLN